jgi:peptidoglycan-associated lipoprotein
MKMTLVYPLALALVATLAAAGCSHKTVKVTPMPAMAMPLPSEPNPNTRPSTDISPGIPINPGDNGGTTGIPQANPDEINGMIPDRAALAAYTIHFAFDSAVIRNSEQASLKSVAQALAADPKTKLLVEGNCDERGTEGYNQSLGEKRALAAREALAKSGVDPMRIFTRSYGKDKPVDPAHDDAAWAKNRRDDFVLLHPKPGM